MTGNLYAFFGDGKDITDRMGGVRETPVGLLVAWVGGMVVAMIVVSVAPSPLRAETKSTAGSSLSAPFARVCVLEGGDVFEVHVAVVVGIGEAAAGTGVVFGAAENTGTVLP